MIDQSVDLGFLLGGVGFRVGGFGRQDVVHQSDEWALLGGGYLGDRQTLHGKLLPLGKTHSGCQRGILHQPSDEGTVQNRVEVFQG